jgi:hypothetical protein
MSLGFGSVGPIVVKTTSHRGFTPEEISDSAVQKIVHIADTAHPVIRDQAIAFRDRVQAVMVTAMKQAIKSDRTTLAAKLREAGQHEAANIVGKL